MASDDITSRGPDPFVKRLRSDAPEDLPGPSFEGFYTPSDHEGYGRLYLQRDAYIEFSLEDVVFHATIPEEQSPVLGERATAIRLARGASVVYSRELVTDEFDVDPRRLPERFKRCPGLSTFVHGC
jgi:hypothetical protein